MLRELCELNQKFVNYIVKQLYKIFFVDANCINKYSNIFIIIL